MGKRKDARAAPAAETLKASASAPRKAKLVSIGTKLTAEDRKRWKRLAIKLGISGQRSVVRALNAYLAAHGEGPLTPVLTGKQGRQPRESRTE